MAPFYDVKKGLTTKIGCTLEEIYFTCLTIERKHETLDEYYLEIVFVYVYIKYTR